jgi:hypothetical protein
MARKLRTLGSKTVSTTAVLLCRANPARVGLIVQETGGTNDFRWMDQDTDVADTVGVWVKAGETFVWPNDLPPTGDIYGIRESTGDATVTVIEVEG